MAQIPPTKLIKDVLDGLLGKDVTTTPCATLTSVEAAGGVLAVYVDDTGTLQAVTAWDIPAAVRVGAAVGLIPARGAQDAIDQKYIPEALQENLGEVGNVMASVFLTAGNSHMRFYRSYYPVAAAPQDAIALLHQAGQRIDLTLDIPGYGAGKFALSMKP